MSNILKSKVLLGAMIVASVFVGAMLLATVASAQTTTVVASGYTYSGVMKVGMSGPGISTLQAALNDVNMGTTIVVDGDFGPATKAAVMKFQVSKGLTADGVVGPMTGSALAAATVSVITVPSNLPAGCTATSTYSSTTGDKCVAGTMPAGCTSTTTYSPTNGEKCVAGSTPTTPGSLQGGAGTLDSADFVSSLNNEEVGEGQEDVAVVGLDLGADDGSDLEVVSVRVSFEEQGAGGSVDFDDYAESVSIWFEGEMVGEADVNDFNEDADIWTKTISLDSGAVIDADEEGTLEVAVTANGSIDSADLGSANNDWDAIIENVRFEDADGVVQTEDGLDDIGVARPFFFDSFASANDVELTVRKASDTPDEQAVTVDADGGDEVVLLAGELEAEGSDIEVNGLTVTVTPAGTGDASEIATRYMLMIGDEEIDSIDSDECEVVGDCDGTGTATAVEYVFDMDGYMVDEGDTVAFEVVAELDEISATFVDGDSLDTSVDSTDVDAEDESGEDLTGAELTGVANGEEQSFFSEGIIVDNIEASSSVTFTADDAGEESIGKFVIEFEVTANETEIYLDKSTDGSGTSGTNGEGVVYTVDTSATPSATSATFECVSNCGSSGDNTADEFYIAEGETETYRLTVNVTAEAAVTDDYAVWIDSINWDSSDTAASTMFYTSNLGEDSDADTGSEQLISL